MQRRQYIQVRSRERGQTLALVAIFLVVLIGMAALAIDTTTLYVAHNETQRAADAAALAGAKAFVDSGVTTAPNEPSLHTLARNIATAYINATLTKNKVQGVSPSLVGAATPVYPVGNPGNPQITVTLQRTNLPTFFARVFGQTLATVTASATAEAYNSSNSGTGSNMPPVAPTCVKPWLVPNLDPNHGNGPFVNPDGTLAHPGVWGGAGNGVLGEPINMANIFEQQCGLGPICVSLPALLTAPNWVGYLPAKLASSSGPCPSCGGAGGAFETSVACCDSANVYSCGGVGPNVLIDLLSNDVTSTLKGAACLLTGSGGSGASTGIDDIDFGNFRSGSGPIEIEAGSGPHNGQFVNTSGQIVTMPIIDTTLLNILTGQVKVIGFMQAFVTNTHADGDVVVDVLNISGCGSNVNTASTPISGGGVSPVPVRLIHN